MRILFIGDLFGDIGRRVLAEHLEGVVEKHKADVVIANGENCAGGRGITVNYAKKLRKYGVDIITGGNHSHAHTDVFSDEKYGATTLRPHNIKNMKKGKGHTVFTLKDGRKIGVVNLQGEIFINCKVGSPFKSADSILEFISEETNTILVDFHAEATSEKICLAHHLDGRITALVGTHTHVQTADARILPNKTAFITDVGMTGPELSAIGMQHEPIIEKLITGKPNKFVQAKDDPMLNAVLIESDDDTGLAISITPIFERYQF
jgi:metallophosphoesterase (TIGR00282 family)